MTKKKIYYFETVLGEFGVEATSRRQAELFIVQAVTELLSLKNQYESELIMAQRKWGLSVPDVEKTDLH